MTDTNRTSWFIIKPPLLRFLPNRIFIHGQFFQFGGVGWPFLNLAKQCKKKHLGYPTLSKVNEVWKMIFVFNLMIFSFQLFIFREFSDFFPVFGLGDKTLPLDQKIDGDVVFPGSGKQVSPADEYGSASGTPGHCAKNGWQSTSLPGPPHPSNVTWIWSN